MKKIITKKRIRQIICGVITCTILTGCMPGKDKTALENEESANKVNETSAPGFEIIPETFELNFLSDSQKISISKPQEERKVADFSQDANGASWTYPDEKVKISIEPQAQYLSVAITSLEQKDNEFQWPAVSGETYYMPFGDGKRIPSNDPVWMDYLKDAEFPVIEQFSMSFFAAVQDSSAVLYIMEEPFHSSMDFEAKGNIQMNLVHRFPEIVKEKEERFRIYLTSDNPVEIAGIYKDYVKEKGKFKTLEQKAEENPNIEKLYGAPHIYLWGSRIITPKDIQWPKFLRVLSKDILTYIRQLAGETENKEEAELVFAALAEQDYVDEYQKNVICRIISQVLQKKEFYKETVFPESDEYMKELLKKGFDNLTETERIQFNKHALAVNLPEVFAAPKDWAETDTTGLIKELKKSGIEQAWIGLNDWTQAYIKPELTDAAIKEGYLIGPYDSYHSIHEPGKEQWITAQFPDTSLYENAAITNAAGEKIMGFNQVGRKLNPVLSLPSVKERVNTILSNPVSFNSWFIDCDATGEIYDDYSKEHITTEQEDLKARLERMAFIREQKQMVIGSEGGNDFAASDIAFAHGIELQSFSWMDKDMSQNKDSEYYIGKYYSSYDGVAEHFSKQIPIKDKYYHLFLDMAYQVPFYKMVYNNSVITGYHWDWSTFKIKDRVEERMLREVLYNTPPLYHLDAAEWEKHKEAISRHTSFWSEFSKKAIELEVTDFERLTKDGQVQLVKYGEQMSVIANFTSKNYNYGGKIIPALSLLLIEGEQNTIYTPKA